MIQRHLMVLRFAALIGGALFAGVPAHAASKWTAVVDGAEGLENFTVVGKSKWSAVEGAIQGDGTGEDASYLLSRGAYGDFTMRVEFWASEDANSGVFIRCQDPAKIAPETCYEANIFDQRPDPTYGTGAIVKVAPVAAPMPKAGGKWNTYEITARGPRLTLVLNGKKTVDVKDSQFARGPFALQWARGTIKFRKIRIKPL